MPQKGLGKFRGFALLASALMILSAFAAGVALTGPSGDSSPTAPPSEPDAPLASQTALNVSAIIPQSGDGGAADCPTPFGSTLLSPLEIVCDAFHIGEYDVVGANEQDVAFDVINNLGNYLNATASATANYNATTQELLTYFADRAEAVVPYFVGQPWDNETYDEIASYSGLSSAIEGLETSIAEQEYQDWNATVWTYQNAFGSGEEYCCIDTTNLLATGYGNPSDASGFFIEGDQPSGHFRVSQPWEEWSGYKATAVDGKQYGNSTIYFTLEPGGNIIDANVENASSPTYGEWTVTDVTTGDSYPVPDVSYDDFGAGSGFSDFSTEYGIGQFDLLKATCAGDCDTDAGLLETSGAYAFEDAAPAGAIAAGTWTNELVNTMTPEVWVDDDLNFTAGSWVGAGWTAYPVPSSQIGVCIGLTAAVSGSGACSTIGMDSEGVATDLGSGPAQAVGGNDTLSQYALTMQHLLNNTMDMAYAYYEVLSAVTVNGTYAIPATCSIPTPSDAFPGAADPAFYGLTQNNVLAVYLAYLDANARLYGQLFSSAVGFCGDANLGFSFNWTQDWKLSLNISADIYLGSLQGAVSANGSLDASEVLATPTTWAIQSVDPTILYPFEYQLDVPVGTVEPIPFDDPVAGVLVDWSGNAYYGNTSWKPDWGVPTYLSLGGYGNAVYPNGTVSRYASGGSNASGDAIDITTCELNGVEQNPCDLSATYFDGFTIGILHADIFPSCQATGTCGSSSGGSGGGFPSGTDCGFGDLNAWYDGWVGDIGQVVAEGFVSIGHAGAGIPLIGGGWNEFWTGLGCVLAWIVVIVIVIVLLIAVVWLARKIWDAVEG